MYQEGYYREHSQEEMKAVMLAAGFSPTLINNPKGYTYSRHQHQEAKLLAFISGKMKVWAGYNEFVCTADDRLFIPGKIQHSAEILADCRFLWAEKQI